MNRIQLNIGDIVKHYDSTLVSQHGLGKVVDQYKEDGYKIVVVWFFKSNSLLSTGYRFNVDDNSYRYGDFYEDSLELLLHKEIKEK